MKFKPLLYTLAMLLGGMMTPAQAVDTNAGDYDPMPAGTTLALWYQQHTKADTYDLDLRGNTHGSELKSNISIARFIHYMDLAGFRIDPQILLPFGHVYDAKVGADHLGTASGMADPIVGGTLWLINDPTAGNLGRNLGLSALVTIPLGKYDSNDRLNMGNNRWVGDFQVGWSESVWGNNGIELLGDFIYYGDNDDYLGSRLEKHPSYQLQLHYRYDFAPGQRVALLYNSSYGGKEYLGGSYIGAKTDYQKIGAEYQHMLTNKLQLLGQVMHDLDVDGGFEQDYSLLMRATYIF